MQQVTLWLIVWQNYNFALSYHSGKTNLDVDALSHIMRWEHDQHTEAESVHALIVQVVQGSTLIEAYSCNIQVTETLNMQIDPKAMVLESWIVAQVRTLCYRKLSSLLVKTS